ncbi:Adenylate cyclase (EC [Olavius algarvensis associated proteobacterium Delta 3]|nr:Adenylate cyclase (EC [Olavius algarvensis associated proteobacterium Delta 3]
MLTTLRGKFLVFILLPVLAALIAITSVSYFSARRYLIDQMKRSGLDALKADAARFKNMIIQVHAVLGSIAIAEEIGGLTDSQRKKIFIKISDALGNHVTSVFMGFPDGRMVRSKKTLLPKGYDPRERPWYREALTLPPEEFYGATYPYLDASTKDPTITFFRRILDKDGQLIGVGGIDVDIARIVDTLSQYTGLPKNGVRFILSDDARILVHPEMSRVGTYLDHSREAMDVRFAELIRDPTLNSYQFIGERADQRWYMGFHRIENTRGFIALMLPAEEVLRPLNNLIREMSIIATALIFILLIVLLVMTRKITRPVYALTEAARKVVKEDEYQDAIDVPSKDELGQLTESFNVMMEGLRQRDFIRDTFGRYVTKEVVEELIDNPDGLRLGGEKREVTIMFSDIRGFTPLSEHLGPEQVVDLLNRYLGDMADIVEKYGGTVSEFVGDAILAFFGAPVDHGDSPSRAVACAVEMQMAMVTINKDNVESGLSEVAMGIGINTGDVIVGNIGSERRAKYGVVGHAINLTARVESSTIGGQILISEATYDKVKDTVIIKQERKLRLKGVDEEVVLYDVAGVTFPERLMVPALHEVPLPLSTPLDVRVIRMKDKKEAEFVNQGRLTHFSANCAHVALNQEIRPPTEIRIDFCDDRECVNEKIYGRVVEATNAGDGFEHMLRISYASPEAQKHLKQLLY